MAETVAAVWALDQKSALLGRSAASRNQQLKRLVEQVSAPLSALRTLGYFLQDRMRPQEEAAQDLVDNMVIQGDRLQEVAEQLQAALYPDTPPPPSLGMGALMSQVRRVVVCVCVVWGQCVGEDSPRRSRSMHTA